MAIIIPSKSIYKKDNPKVRDNLIDKIEVSATDITPSNEYETPIYSVEISKNYFTDINTYKDYASEALPNNLQIWSGSKSYVELKTTYLTNYHIEFNRLNNNKYISKIYEKLNSKGEPNIKHTVYYNKKVYNISVSDIKELSDGNYNLIGYNETLKEEIDSSGIIPNPIISIGSYVEGYPEASSNAKIEKDNLTNLSSLDVGFDEENDKFTLDVNVLVGLETYSLTGKKERKGSLAEVQEIPCSGERVVYTPKTLEITIYGDTIGIDLTDKTVIIGEGSKPLSFEGNELMQVTNYLNTPINGKSGAIEDLYTSTLNAFKNGKETATIRCSITNYYDSSFPPPNNSPTINVNSNVNKYIKEGMQVIPMVFGADGKDKPMSYYGDGTDKIFNVLSTKIVYDGVPMQELTIQEADK